MAQVILSKLM